MTLTQQLFSAGFAPRVIKQPNDGKNVYTWRGQTIRIAIQVEANPPPSSCQWYFQRLNSDKSIPIEGAGHQALEVCITMC